MKENITYSECLSEILKALNLKCSSLARELNIDSSLVYKWLRNERVPSYDSPYIGLILTSLSRRTFNLSQRKALLEVLANHGIEIFEASKIDILNNLKLILQNSQGYSIKLHNKIKCEQKLSGTRISSVAGFIKNIDAKSSINDHNSFDTADIHSPAKNEAIHCDRENVQVIKGNLEVLYTIINLLERTPKAPLSEDNTILITLNSDSKPLLTQKGLNQAWIQTLYNLLSSGWKLILYISLDSNVKRTIKIIENIQVLLTAGNLTIYYYYEHPNDLCKGTELFIIPQTGALICFSTHMKNQIDSAFLFHSKSSMELLSARFFLNLNSARSLLTSYPPQKSAEYQKALAESEETPGEKNVFKRGLSSITIPLPLYEKYLKHNGIANQELSYRTFLHKRRLDAFEKQIIHYKFRDICFIESIVDLADKKEYPFDEKYLIQDYALQNADVICHLENLINLLQKYDYYNIAFVSKSYFENINNIYWVVKGDCCVMIETINKNRIDCSFEMNFSITEKSVVNAFQDYFNILWDSIPDENKDKRNSITWLKSLVKKCNGQTD
ncbi:MAG: hypothetical protein PHP52_13995 [Bacteroidales bacterium]|nr:hypothetical protein [Bacteroidales bacterium]